jgi:hypothetical protein
MKKRHGFLIGFAAVLLAAIVTLAGCADSVDPEDEGSQQTLRYETHPYIKSGAQQSVSRAGDVPDVPDVPDQLVYSAYDDANYYYLFLLGDVSRVPLAYRPAVEYGGKTPITIGYSSSNVTEKSIGESISKANEYSVSNSTSYNWGVETEVSFGTELSPVKGRIQVSGGGEYGWSDTNTRSFENTWETISTNSHTTTDEISVTVGNNNELPGLYRYSLFATADIYQIVLTDHSKKVIKSYRVFCARPQSFWGLDYEPDTVNATFGKTASGDLLTPPEIDVSTLPIPENNDILPIPADKAKMPVANLDTGSYEAGVLVSLTSDESGAAIYYTTDQSTPTASSTLYTGVPFPLNSNTTLNAIAIVYGKEPSLVLTRTYTITAQAPQTSWHIFISEGEGGAWMNDNAYLHEYCNVRNDEKFKNFELQELKDAGYNYIQIKGTIELKPKDDGYINLFIRPGHSTSSSAWYEQRNMDPYEIYYRINGLGGFLREEDQVWQTFELHSATTSINNFTEQFTLDFRPDGDGSDQCYVRNIDVYFTAIK